MARSRPDLARQLLDKARREGVLTTLESALNKLDQPMPLGYTSAGVIVALGEGARLFALKGLDKYDGIRSLENFLWTHVRNPLYNFKRNNFQRPDRPCFTCPHFNPDLKSECMEYEDTSECAIYYNWRKRNNTKTCLMSSANVDITFDYEGAGDEQHLELQILIEKSLPVENRQDYIRLKQNLKLPKARREKIIAMIKNILLENNIDCSNV